MNTQTPDRQHAHSAAESSLSPTASRFTARSRLIHDWATRALREEERDEVLAVLGWLAVHGDHSYLGALAIVNHRFPGDPVIAATTEAVIGRIEARE